MVERHGMLFEWLAGMGTEDVGVEPPPPWACAGPSATTHGSGETTPTAALLRGLSARGVFVPLGSHVPRESVLLAALFLLGVRGPAMEAAWSIARGPVALAEALLTPPRDFKSYPMATPTFAYDEGAFACDGGAFTCDGVDG
jgi:hypothetical protein